eukprot:358258-Chlamydomonas_euryale.AAC.2
MVTHSLSAGDMWGVRGMQWGTEVCAALVCGQPGHYRCCASSLGWGNNVASLRWGKDVASLGWGKDVASLGWGRDVASLGWWRM